MPSPTDLKNPITLCDRPIKADEKSSLGFCPICNSEGRTKTGEFIICERAHPFTQSESLIKPRQLSFAALEALKNLDAPYGYCPMCNAKGISRESRLNGYDHCVNGHGYNSEKAIPKPTGKFCPTVNCNSVRVHSEWRSTDYGACGYGHVHKIAAFVEQEIK